MTPGLVIARKEASALVLNPRSLLRFFLVSLALGSACLMLIAPADRPGAAQAVRDMAGIVIVLGVLLAMVAGHDAIAGEYDRITLLPLLLAPVSRGALMAGKLCAPLTAWGIVYVLAMPCLWAIGGTGQSLAAAVAAIGIVGTPMAAIFGLLSLGLGARLVSSTVSLAVGVATLLLCATALVPGLHPGATIAGQLVDGINPMAGAREALDALIVKSMPVWTQGAPLVLIAAWLCVALLFAATAARRLGRDGR
jgi:ABC-type transport system involved in multi-copper enzyme maturation permease subunit